ncbi:MAG: zf-HC2 domain-containing protein [Pseudonocardiaceae bacterium]
MTCAECREALSARLDGEDAADERRAVDLHLASCAQCRGFGDSAARITRLARTGVAVSGPDLVDAVLAAAPPRRAITPARVARVLLAVVAVGQMGLSLAGLLAVNMTSTVGHVGAQVGGATMAHMSHEAAAWNLAIGAGFLWVSLQSSRSAGLVPVLSAFVGLLTLLSTVDLVLGRVEPIRLLTHGLVVVGLALVLLLDRQRRNGGGSTPGVHRGYTRQRKDDPADVGDVADDDGSPRLRPTARQRAA